MNTIFYIYLFITFLFCHLTVSLIETLNETTVFMDKDHPILFTVDDVLPKLNEEQVKNFYLFTRDYREGKEYERIDPHNVSSIKNCHFKSVRTYVIIHGFLGNGLESWILELKDKLLLRGDYNVICVDWPAGTQWFLPSYKLAANRVPIVGNNTADLLHSLIERQGLLLSNLHMIGHSLGAHICGFTGKRFQGRIAKISGLDPAGPEYRHMSKKKRLDKTDAVYVDVIHTNACTSWFFFDCYGITEDIGHSNFWPNNGSHQPFCNSFNRLIKGEFGCNHELAYVYYIESLNYDTSSMYFLARKCKNWDEYLSKNCSCGDKPQFMGINSNADSVGKFFLKTEANQPFAISDDCHFGGMNWPLLAIFCSVTILAFVVAFGVYYSYTHTAKRYRHIHSSRCIIVNERTHLIS